MLFHILFLMKKKKKVKYKRKAKKNGKPRMEPKLRRFLIFITIFLIILAALILILIVKPAFLEDVFNKDQSSEVNVGGTASSKSVNKPSVPSPSSNGGSSPPSAASSSGGTNDFPDYSAYYSRLPGVLTQSPMVQDVPKGETILLRFYNFNTGVREFEKSYLLTKANAKEGYLDDPEITIVVHSKYVPEINSNNLCETITKAGSNNDVGIYTDLGTTKLVLKFKSMMEYKDCLM
jgi:hypothetical protein